MRKKPTFSFSGDSGGIDQVSSILQFFQGDSSGIDKISAFDNNFINKYTQVFNNNLKEIFVQFKTK